MVTFFSFRLIFTGLWALWIMSILSIYNGSSDTKFTFRNPLLYPSMYWFITPVKQSVSPAVHRGSSVAGGWTKQLYLWILVVILSSVSFTYGICQQNHRQLHKEQEWHTWTYSFSPILNFRLQAQDVIIKKFWFLRFETRHWKKLMNVRRKIVD